MPDQPRANSDRILISALMALTQQVQLLLEFQQEMHHKEEAKPKVLRDEAEARAPKPSAPVQPPLTQGMWDGFYTGNIPPRKDLTDEIYAGAVENLAKQKSFSQTLDSLNDAAKQAQSEGQSKLASWRTALGTMAPQPEQPTQQQGQPGPNTSTPPGAGGLFGGPGGGHPGGHSISDSDAFTWAVLGEHGGPAFVRNLALEQYGLQRSVDWGAKSAQWAKDQVGDDSPLSKVPGVRTIANESNMNALQGVLAMASKHPLATYAAYKTGSLAVAGLHKSGAGLQDWENQGAQLGVPTSPNRYILGMHVPWSPLESGATSVGAGAAVNVREMEGQIPGGLGVGSGISREQALQIRDVIEGAGFGANENKFGGGDIGSIANQYMAPLVKQYPGLTGEDLGQFIPALRNSGTSLEQLRSTLSDLGDAAAATHETIGQAATSLTAMSESMQGMGSMQGAWGLGQGFRNITGMDPQIMGQMAQSPMYQGLMMSQQGILPSGIADVNPGMATHTGVAMLQMLQRATAGLNRNKYENIGGQHVLVQSGKQAQIDQIAQMSGMDPNIVRRMLGDQSAITARAQVGTALGSSTQGTGLYQLLSQMGGSPNKQQSSALKRYWSSTMTDANLSKSGISKDEIKQLNAEGNWRKRADMLKKDLDHANSRDSWNQVQQKSNKQTVQVQFTGAAAKIFQQVGPTSAKQAANAGQFSYSGVANSILGDIGKLPGVGAVNDLAHGDVIGAAENVASSIVPLPARELAGAIGGLFG